MKLKVVAQPHYNLKVCFVVMEKKWYGWRDYDDIAWPSYESALKSMKRILDES